MNILLIKHFFVGFIVSEILRVSVFGYFPLYEFNNLISLLFLMYHSNRKLHNFICIDNVVLLYITFTNLFYYIYFYFYYIFSSSMFFRKVKWVND